MLAATSTMTLPDSARPTRSNFTQPVTNMRIAPPSAAIAIGSRPIDAVPTEKIMMAAAKSAFERRGITRAPASCRCTP